MKKKIVVFFLIFSLMMSLVTVSIAAQPQVTHNIEGYMIKAKDIQEVLGGGNYEYHLETKELVKPVHLQINNISIANDEINLSGDLKFNDMVENFRLEGNLYTSRGQESGIDSYIGVLKDVAEKYEVLHFKIKKNEAEDLSLYHEEFRVKPLLKLYLLNTQGDIIYFEEELSKLDVDLSNLKTDGTYAESIYDGNWFHQIVEAEKTTIPNDSNQNYIMASEDYVKACDLIHIANVQVGNDTVEYRACPYTEGSIVNLAGAGGSSFWTSKLTISESVRVNGGGDFGIEQQFAIGGVSYLPNETVGSIAAGQNSRLQSRLFDATYLKSNSTVTTNWPVILGYFTKFNPYYAAGWTAYTALTAISYDSSPTLISGNDSYVTLPNGSSVVSVKIDKEAYLNDGSHSIDYTVVAATWDSQQTQSESTTLVVQWNFDLSYFGDREMYYNWQIPVNYLTNN